MNPIRNSPVLAGSHLPLLVLLMFLCHTETTFAQTASAPVTTSISVTELSEYATLSPEIQKLISDALKLTTLGLHYQYGSANPSNGGMDCSGTIHYLLKEMESLKEVPRQANLFYRWIWLNSRFHAVTSFKPDGFEWSKLQPGDLLFWSGTCDVDRDPPITHVMIYLGTLKKTGKRVMFGASRGRRYESVPQNGVSVFNLDLPGKNASARFLGYGSIPNLISPPAH